MANLEEMEMKYTVIKNEDILSLPKGTVWMQSLNNICHAVNVNRLPKQPNTYLVINTDEPYVDEIINILKRHGHWG
jgi:hypothetical protein